MKVKFLGTAAAEGIPGLFCNCETCKRSLELKGKNIRKRSSAIIDNKLMFDYTNDFLSHVHDYSMDFVNLEHIFITHSHSDHFNYYDLEMRLGWYTNGNTPILNIYANETCIGLIEALLKDKGNIDEYFKFHVLKPYSEVNVEGYNIMPLPARHITDYKDETALNYIVRHNGKTLFYGLDSGWYFDEVWDRLESTSFDCMVMDCTGGFLPASIGNHMALDFNLRMVDRLRQKYSVNEGTKLIATHFSHHGGVIYDRDNIKFSEKGFIMAFDGMEVEI